MTPDAGRAAHEIVAAFARRRGYGAWRIDRAVVADRLHELVDRPRLVRQGGLNLCGPAALFHVWFEGQPVAAVTYATRLYEEGRAAIGVLDVSASAGLLELAYVAQRCPPADWMMMAALRDSSNRFVRYNRPGGLWEPAAAITMPGALRRWLRATGVFVAVRDETNLLLRKDLRHASQVSAGAGQKVVALVAQEMFRHPTSRPQRARDAVVALVPNHWAILTAPMTKVGDDSIRLRFWSWGREHALELSADRFARCYFGALVGQFVE